MNRREALVTLAASPLLAAADAGSLSPAPAARAPRPLPFNAARLKGLSEKLLVSHHDNNYGGGLKNLGKVVEENGRETKADTGFALSRFRVRRIPLPHT